MAIILWLLMAILWVYLPKYSTTVLGVAKGRLAYTTHFFLKTASYISCGMLNSLFLNSVTYFALNTLLMDFTLNKYLLLFFAFFHFPALLNPPPGTIQCKCGCKLKF